MRLINSAHVDVFAGLVRRGAGRQVVKLTVRYGLIDRPDGGLCLVDTGFGTEITQPPRSVALKLYHLALRPNLIPGQTAATLLPALGARPSDIRTVVVTHFHADHISSLRIFPRARLIACGEAARAIMAASAVRALHAGVFKELIPADLAHRIVPLQSLAQVKTGTVLGDGYDLFGDASYLAVALPGHALGHFGIFWRDQAGPVLYATDATWTMAALKSDQTPWLSRGVVFHDRGAGRRTEATLRAFARGGGRLQLCHDVEEPGW